MTQAFSGYDGGMSATASSDLEAMSACPVWRQRTWTQWRARLAVFASRGETTGPRVEECRTALAVWRLRNSLLRDWQITETEADALVKQALEARDDTGAVVHPLAYPQVRL